jgi:hypothetical protein
VILQLTATGQKPKYQKFKSLKINILIFLTHNFEYFLLYASHSSLITHHFCHLRQVVIVVFGHKKGEVNQAHGGAETGVNGGFFEVGGLKLAEQGHCFAAFSGKKLDQVGRFLLVVVALVGAGIGEVGHGQLGFARRNLLHAGVPERFEVEQVTDLLAQAPLACGSGVKIGWQVGRFGYQTSRGAFEAFEDTGQQAVVDNGRENAVEPFCLLHCIQTEN